MGRAALPARAPWRESGIGRLADAGLDRRRFVAGLIACVAIAGVLAGVTLGREALGHDELETLAYVSQPLEKYVDAVPIRQNGVLFDLALWSVVHLGGQSEAWLRLLPLLAFMGSVALLGILGARLCSRSVGLVAALLLAVHPFGVVYAQNARPYAFALFFALLSVLLLDRALERPAVGRWVAYVLAVAATWYSHDIAILALVAHPVLVFFRGRGLLRSYGLALLGVVAVGVPLVALVPFGLGSDALWWLSSPWPRQAGKTVYWLGGTWIGLIPSLAILVAGALRFRSLRRAGRPIGVEVGTVAFVASWVALPATIAFFISLWRPILEPRYFLSSVAAVCLALSIALAVLPRLGRGLGITVLVVAFTAASVRANVLKPEPDWRSIVSYLDMHVVEDQRVVTVGAVTEKYRATNALEYYSRVLGGDRRHFVLEPGDEEAPDRIIVDRRANADRLGAEARSGRGVWVVVWGQGSDGDPLPLPAAFAGCTAEQRLSPGGSVFVYYVSKCDG